MLKFTRKNIKPAKKTKIHCVNEPELSDSDESCLCGPFLREIERRLRRISYRDFFEEKGITVEEIESVNPGYAATNAYTHTMQDVEYIKQYSYTFNCSDSRNTCLRARVNYIFKARPKLVERFFGNLDLKGLDVGPNWVCPKKRGSQLERAAKQAKLVKDSQDEWDVADEQLAYAFADALGPEKEEKTET